MKPRLCVIVCLLGTLLATSGPAAEPQVDVHLSDTDERVMITREPDGTHRFQLKLSDGKQQSLTPEEFATRVYDEQHKSAWWKGFLNITTPMGMMWVGVGLLGQLLFTGRMLVQWLASEREKRSVVPEAFWWMSLLGATMLIVYFGWRKDVVGILGQGTGWVIYIRNLILIYRSRPSPTAHNDPAPEPGLE